MSPIFHPVGTCRIRAYTISFVDAELRMHDISGLRIADGSIMASVGSGRRKGLRERRSDESNPGVQLRPAGGPAADRAARSPPGPGEVAIDVVYAAVGLIDVFIRQGLYRDRPGLPQPPYVPGLEVAGTVRALGEGVAGFEVGEPVVTLSANTGTGGYAAIFVSDAAYVASMKDVNLDPALAVAVVANGATAYLALTQIARIRDGERVLVHGGPGRPGRRLPEHRPPAGCLPVGSRTRSPVLTWDFRRLVRIR
jgi:GMC oxidoreductase/Alcohol dehydrogenase GroES-like domain